jgi:hypothetical protein
MANAVVVQFAVLAMALVIVVGGIYVAVKFRSMSAQLRNQAPQASPPIQVLTRVEPEREALPIVAPRPQPPAQTVENVSNLPAKITTDPSTALMTYSRGDLARSQARQASILQGISANIRQNLQLHPAALQMALLQSRASAERSNYLRVRKETIGHHPAVRFSLLKEWTSINMLAIFRRALLAWETAEDLVGMVPSHLEPEADLLNGQVLLVGTTGHSEKLAIPVRTIEASSRLRDCFDFAASGRPAANTPAVLLCSNTQFELISRGTVSQSVWSRMESARPKDFGVPVFTAAGPAALEERYERPLLRLEGASTVSMPLVTAQ